MTPATSPKSQFVIGLNVGDGRVNYVVVQSASRWWEVTQNIGDARRFLTHREADTVRSSLNDLWVRRAVILRVEVKPAVPEQVTLNDEYA